MSFIKLALDQVTEPQIVPEGKYTIRVLKAEERVSKAAAERGEDTPNMLSGMLGIESADHPDAAPLFFHLMYPDDMADHEDDKEKWERINIMRMRELKRFLVAFSIPFEADGFDADDAQGTTAELTITQSEDDNEGSPTYKQMINEFVLPRLPAEAVAKKGKGKTVEKGNTGKVTRRR